MRRLKHSWLVLALLLLCAVSSGVMVMRRMENQDARARESGGTITYHCSSTSGSVDFDLKTIGPTELSLIARRGEGPPTLWLVRLPGANALPARNFDAGTGSIGGSQGISWRAADGRAMTATLSFSDLHGDYGVATIWMALDERTLTCGPDAKSHRPD